MHPLIAKLLEKRGIEDLSQLDLESGEKATFQQWEQILSEGKITVDKIAEFCGRQLKVIEKQWRELDNDKVKNERLVIQHTVYSSILEAIEAPQAERESLERRLQKLVDEA
ncbi:MAG: hypothetical protein CMB99_15375 [Flavobacteriaceae bacterium]|mgnify:CR=1 FL=1|jgi:hypothetical protein|nr:hypothetical protein [Flavobacteriaceae bacterium]|tara:strand:+ start:226 stop:558 length:333 start_codon:yes stop_codon:yes gene_type:complete